MEELLEGIETVFEGKFKDLKDEEGGGSNTDHSIIILRHKTNGTIRNAL
jgi:hypothetical protein